jgi:hypothetical protein
MLLVARPAEDAFSRGEEAAMTTAQIDEAKVEEFVGKVLGDVSATTVSILAGIGERLGLWKDLATGGPATSQELARRTGISERYAREWLEGMTVAGYLYHDSSSGRFTLPAEHEPVFAQEGGPHYFGGVYQMTLGLLEIIEPLTEAFRTGKGVPQSAYPQDVYAGMERFTAGWFENLLLPVWIPAVPEVQAALEKGIDVCDVGCGQGRALIKLAEAFPASRFVGYDIFEPVVKEAEANARAAGVSGKVRFEARDVAQGLPDQFDLVTTFDVIHDSADPLGILKVIHQALRPGGTYLCLDINC